MALGDIHSVMFQFRQGLHVVLQHNDGTDLGGIACHHERRFADDLIRLLGIEIGVLKQTYTEDVHHQSLG